MNRENYVLWLPSWYPNEWEPYNGDFIQRHAEAAALNNNITVIFFTQYGEKMAMDHKVTETVTGNLKEVIVYLPFKPSRFELADRVRYNLFFYQYSKRFLPVRSKTMRLGRGLQLTGTGFFGCMF